MLSIRHARTVVAAASALVVLLIGAGAASEVAAAPTLAGAYAGTVTNTTVNVTSTFRLTGITTAPDGTFSGQADFDPPIVGDGPFTGKLTNNTITFTITPSPPNLCGCSPVSTATVDAAGAMTGTFTANTPTGVQNGTFTAAPVGGPPAVTPAPLPPAFGANGVFALPSTTTCVSRRHFRIRIRRQRAGITLISAAVAVNGRRVAVRKGSRLTAPVDLRGLPKGRFTVRISALTSDGRAITGTRRYRTCAPKAPSNAPGPV